MNPVRDELDIERTPALLEYLRRTERIEAGETPVVRNLPGGVSCRTVLLERPTGEAWVLKQALAKLRVRVDWFSDPARMHREALALRYLVPLAPTGAITPLIFEDETHHLLAMRAVPQPHQNWKAMLLAGDLQEQHFRDFGTMLGTIHQRSAQRSHELAAVFEDRSFFESLRMEAYYAYTGSQVPQARDFMQRLIATVRANRQTLVHGDYSPKNVLVYQGKLVLLDHEVIHWGDPAFDLGFSLTHLLSKAHHVCRFRGQFARAAKLHWESYVACHDSPGLERRAVLNTLGCLLARVNGRSPLEYLDEPEREAQRRAVLSLMVDPPQGVSQLVDRFLEQL